MACWGSTSLLGVMGAITLLDTEKNFNHRNSSHEQQVEGGCGRDACRAAASVYCGEEVCFTGNNTHRRQVHIVAPHFFVAVSVKSLRLSFSSEPLRL